MDSENLVQDLQDELDMKESLTVKELVNEACESKELQDSYVDVKEATDSFHNQKTDHYDQPCVPKAVDNSDSMSKIEAELEAELERLEFNMSSSCREGKESFLDEESSVPNASLPGSNVAVQMNPQQFIGNQTMRSVVYMFPGVVDPQMFGNAPMMPWLYQQMLQASQQPDAAPGARQAVKRRKLYRGRKPVESVQETQTPPDPCAS